MSLRIAALLLTAAMTSTSAFGAKQTTAQACEVELIVLGTGQDAGAPQIGNNDDAAWSDDSLSLWPASIAVVDHANSARFLFEATPAITGQLQLLHTLVGPHDAPLGLDGVFLTHAHIGHYAGLLYAGHEAAGAKKLNVYAMPRMREFLENNAPWSQLVSFENITLHSLSDQTLQPLTKNISVTPLLVPHRDEFSETVGYIITAGGKRVLFLPDINSWDDWRKQDGTDISELLKTLDYAYIDATFYDNNELPGRDMSQFPHPRIAKMMGRFDALSAAERAKVRFIHLNHSNPARNQHSMQYAQIQQRGYQVAMRGERICLSGQAKTNTKVACSPAGFDHEQLIRLKEAKFKIDDDKKRNAFARELTSCLAHPDPVLRDEIGYTGLTQLLRSGTLSVDTIKALRLQLMQQLREPSDTDGFAKPFAALALAEVVRADRISALFSNEERAEIVSLATDYQRSIRDYRGFSDQQGWRHGVAHGADLLMQLTLNPDINDEHLLPIVQAAFSQVGANDGHFYVYGEPGRLARPVLFAAQRGALTDEQWQTLFASLTSGENAQWPQNAYVSNAALAKLHNTRAFLQSMHTSVAEVSTPEFVAFKSLVQESLRTLP